MKKSKKKIILILLSCSLVISISALVSLILVYLHENDQEETISYPSIVTINGNAIQDTIADGEEAVSVLAENASDLGYENALSELTPVYSIQTEDSNTYFLQQNYNGIPVYGQTASILTDDTGKAVFLSGSFQDAINIQNDITSSIEEMKKAACNYFGNDAQIITDQDTPDGTLYLYPDDDGNLSYVYAYMVASTGKDHSIYEVLVDAKTCKVVNKTQLMSDLTGYMASDEDQVNGFPVFRGANQYTIGDPENRIFVLNLNGAKLIEYYYTGEGDEIAPVIHIGRAQMVSSDNLIFGDTDKEQQLNAEKGAQYLLNMKEIITYFKETYRDSRIRSTYLFYQDGYSDGNNAQGGVLRDKSRMVTIGKNRSINEFDVLAHEYTHAIQHSVKNWSNNNETRALKEAMADIFGVFAESDISGKAPDWQISDRRNMAAPSGKQLSSLQQYKPTTDCHDASTILSHAAYLMWNGIDGNERARIDQKTLGELLYIAMIDMPADVTFEQCGYIIENYAAVFHSMGILTEEQLKCVDNAFQEVGIVGRNDIVSFADQFKEETTEKQETDEEETADVLSVSEAFETAYNKLINQNFSVKRSGSMTTQFTGNEYVSFEDNISISAFQSESMTISGHYVSSGPTSRSSDTKDYKYTYQNNKMNINGNFYGHSSLQQFTYEPEQPPFTLDLPSPFYYLDSTLPDNWTDDNRYTVALKANALTQEVCNMLEDALPGDYRIIWSKQSDESGVTSATIDFVLDQDGNFKTITVNYALWMGVQGVSFAEGTTTYQFNATESTNSGHMLGNTPD